jgi:hypothetical protein
VWLSRSPARTGAAGCSGRGERALPSVVRPAGWAIDEVQVDDQRV